MMTARIDDGNSQESSRFPAEGGRSTNSCYGQTIIGIDDGISQESSCFPAGFGSCTHGSYGQTISVNILVNERSTKFEQKKTTISMWRWPKVNAPANGQLIWLPVGRTETLATGVELRQSRSPTEQRLLKVKETQIRSE